MDRKRIGKTFFIPASGHRDLSTSQLNVVSSDGLFWSAAPRTATSGYYLSFSSSDVRPQDYYYLGRAHGFSVRPVQE